MIQPSFMPWPGRLGKRFESLLYLGCCLFLNAQIPENFLSPLLQQDARGSVGQGTIGEASFPPLQRHKEIIKHRTLIVFYKLTGPALVYNIRQEESRRALG